MQVYSIGFTKKTAERFFDALRQAGVRRLLDVRLHNSSTLAGFTKEADLPFFLRELCEAEYRHEPILAPSEELFRGIKGGRLSWPEYEAGFLRLMADRRVEDRLDRSVFSMRTVLLCSEVTADKCHRRLVLEYLNGKWGGLLEIVHL
jgi:uncharacterized protein (DUF488 family)